MTLPEFLTQEVDGFIHFTGHRIGLHHVVRLYQDGYSVDLLAEHYPTLPPSLLHRTIAFYLDNRMEVDGYVANEEAAFARQAAASKGPSLSELRSRLDGSRVAS